MVMHLVVLIVNLFLVNLKLEEEKNGLVKL